MQYVEVDIELKKTVPFNEILIALLNEIKFNSYHEHENGLKAYIEEIYFDLYLLKQTLKKLKEKVDLIYTVKKLENNNWNKNWEENFNPVFITNNCIVRAKFHQKPNNIKYDIVITPKMSFGTGHHETTHQMISHILNLEMKSKSVLDMGCGTGVLAILAAMKGADFITAIDIDEWAYLNTIENTLENKCGHIMVKHGGAELLGNKSFDFVFANINLNILLNDMSAYANVMHSGSKIIFSGFYTSDIPLIDKKAESLGMYSIGKTEKNKWAALLYQMR